MLWGVGGGAGEGFGEGDEAQGDGLAGGVDVEGTAEGCDFAPGVESGVDDGGWVLVVGSWKTGIGIRRGGVACLPFEGEGFPGDEEGFLREGMEGMIGRIVGGGREGNDEIWRYICVNDICGVDGGADGKAGGAAGAGGGDEAETNSEFRIPNSECCGWSRES